LIQIETLASQAIFFYLKNAAKFESQKELFDFLDLSLDHKTKEFVATCIAILRRQRRSIGW